MSETPQDHPNIRAIAAGTIAGAFREWPRVQPEAKALLAERDALCSTVHNLSVQLEESGKEERALREIMRRLVHGIDNWNASVEPIIGRPVSHERHRRSDSRLLGFGESERPVGKG